MGLSAGVIAGMMANRRERMAENIIYRHCQGHYKDMNYYADIYVFHTHFLRNKYGFTYAVGPEN